jgi:glucosamine-6-phosphate deaminase
MVGNELGMRQKLPRERNSLVNEVPSPTSRPQTKSTALTVPHVDVSRAASPVLEPMSARLTDENAKTLIPMEALEDSPTTRMSARVVC